MMFSAGFPMFYFLGTLFMLTNYWIFKTLLVKYFKKTTAFNEEMSFNTIWWFKVGLLIHALSTVLMISNCELLPTTNKVNLFHKYLESEDENVWAFLQSDLYYKFGGITQDPKYQFNETHVYDDIEMTDEQKVTFQACNDALDKVADFMTSESIVEQLKNSS